MSVMIYYDTFIGEYVKTIDDIAPPERYIPVTKTENGVYIEKWEVLKDGKIQRRDVSYSERYYYDRIYHDGIMNGVFKYHNCTPVRLVEFIIPEDKFKGYVEAMEGVEQSRMSEFIGGEPISVSVNEPITFKNKTDTAFDVSCGIVFRKSGLYRVSVDGRHVSVAVEPERKKGKWILTEKGAVVSLYECSICGRSIINDTGYVVYKDYPFCHCGANMRGGDE